MRCEVIAVGTELLLGQIIDTNSSWIGEQLALAGIDSHFQTKVGDNLERIVACLRMALDRNEAVILCGGLGPTQDDITREAIAQVMDVPLRRDERIVARIRERFRSRNRPMPENNLRQADVPEGASVIPQMPGTAPGLICPVGNKVIYAVPGVPVEMRQMVLGTLLPDLQSRAGINSVIKSRILRTWGTSESALAEMLAPRIRELDRVSNPTLAFLASGIEGIKVRITAKACDQETVDKIIASEEARLRTLLGDLVFGIDDQTMESVVIDLLENRGLTLGVAETISGGLIGARLSTIPKADRVFRGAILACANEVKSELFGISQSPTVSEAATQAMALAARRLFAAHVGLAVSGIAESDSQQNYPVGTVFLGLAMDDKSEVRQIRLPGQREQIRQFSVISLLNWLRLRLLDLDPG